MLSNGSGIRVVVIGGGLAGLSASAELASRGFEVTLLERAPRVGGKLSAWRDRDGETIEHGIHGWWHQYFNYFDLMRRAGIDIKDVLLPPKPATVIHPDGARSHVKTLRRHYPTPIYLLKYVSQVPKLRFVDLMSGLRVFLSAFAFDHQADYARYDHVSIYEHLERLGGSRAIHERVFSVFARSFAFASTQELSASSVLSGLTFYFIGHQQDVSARWCRGNPQELIIEPIADMIERHGGRIRTNTEALSIVATVTPSGQRIASVSVRHVPAGETTRIPLTDLCEGEPHFVDLNGQPAYVWRIGNEVTAVSARCTHRGCTVDFLPGANTFVCPCHGGRFSLGGRVIEGPPERPLDNVACRIDGDAVILETSGGQQEALDADYFILASEVTGTKRILRASPELMVHEDVRNTLNLGTTEVIVVRLWLDCKLPHSMTSGVFSGLGLLDSFFVLSNFQPEFKSDPGTVIEVQMYVVKDYIELPDLQIVGIVREELGRLIEELRGARMRKWHVNRHFDVFTLNSVGSIGSRPSTNSSIPNLFFAGDWVQLPRQWWMMEKAVTSGRLAANAVMQQAGIDPRYFARVKEPTADEIFTKVVKRASRLIFSLRRSLRKIIGYEPLPP